MTIPHPPRDAWFGRIAWPWRRDASKQGSDLAAAFERAAEGDFVGVLEVAADRETARRTSDPHAERLEQPRKVHRGGLTFDVRVRRQDHLRDLLVLDALQQLLDAQLLRPDALDRRDRALQHVVSTVELVGALDRDDVARLLDHAHERRVAALVEAVPAELTRREVEAPRAPADARLRLGDRARQSVGVFGRGLQQIEGDALRGLRADARKPAQLVDERLDRTFVDRGHSPSRPPRPPMSSPAVRPPMRSCASSCAIRVASTTAATTRSSSISTSSGSTTSGEIEILRRSPVPETSAVTIPPPTDASTVSSARASCAATRSACIFCAWRIIWLSCFWFVIGRIPLLTRYWRGRSSTTVAPNSASSSPTDDTAGPAGSASMTSAGSS